MRITLNTEFYEDGRAIELISIGLVREDGETYYAEVQGAGEICLKSDALMRHVHPYLTGPRKAKSQIAMEIVEFSDLDPEFWVWGGAYDWVALCQLYGSRVEQPPTWPMFVRDFRQVVDPGEMPELNLGLDGPGHALTYASWLMRGMNEHWTSKPSLHIEYKTREILSAIPLRP